jgi:hypothetical protein
MSSTSRPSYQILFVNDNLMDQEVLLRTLQAVRIFSCSSSFRMRGGLPHAFSSIKGLPARQKWNAVVYS